MDSLLQDFRYAVRTLRRRPAFTLAAVLTLAIGVGGTTTVFSVVKTVVLDPLPYADVDRLVMIWGTNAERNVTAAPVFLVDAVDWREEIDELASIALVRGSSATLGGDELPESLSAARVTANVFDVLGVQPWLGRAFTERETVPGSADVVLLSDGFWSRRFARDPEMVGRSILLDEAPHTIVGVMPEGFAVPLDLAGGNVRDIWLPLAVDAGQAPRSNRAVRAVARLASGVTLAQGQAALDVVAGELARRFPQSNAGWGARLESVRDVVVGDARVMLLLALGASGFVLLLACANVANLLVARSVARRREFAIRASLGARRGRLTRQQLTETCGLALIGGGIGVLFAYWATGLIVCLSPGSIPRLESVGVDVRVLLFALVASLVTGVMSGALPALLGSTGRQLESLRDPSARTSGEHSPRRMIGGLVVLQITLALALGVGAGLLGRSFAALLDVDAGFDPSRVVAALLVLPPARYPSAESRAAFTEDAIERLSVLPGVERVGAVNFLPLSGANTVDWFTLQSQPTLRGAEQPDAQFRAVSAGYFQTLRIPIRRGRGLSDAEVDAARPVAVINEAMARRYWPGMDPIGARIKRGSPDADGPWFEIIGVAGNVRHGGPRDEPAPEWYVPHSLDPYSLRALVLRATSNPAALVQSVRATVADIDPQQTLLRIQPMPVMFSGLVAEPRFSLFVIAGFASLALLLAAVGIYSMASYSVAMRERELAVRVALGARPVDVTWLALREAARFTAWGVGLGALTALATSRFLTSQLFEVNATDPATFGGVAAGLAAVAMLASYLPARRAARVDPMESLRLE